MTIDIANETDVDVELDEIHDCARYAMDAMFVHPNVELSIRIIDEAAMETLHVQWMDLPGPTDVMSFPMDELTPGRSIHCTCSVSIAASSMMRMLSSTLGWTNIASIA